jgi:hypothetical protein
MFKKVLLAALLAAPLLATSGDIPITGVVTSR